MSNLSSDKSPLDFRHIRFNCEFMSHTVLAEQGTCRLAPSPKLEATMDKRIEAWKVRIQASG